MLLISDDVTCDSIDSLFKSINVKVLSCFDANTRIPKSFRIRIDKADDPIGKNSSVVVQNCYHRQDCCCEWFNR